MPQLACEARGTCKIADFRVSMALEGKSHRVLALGGLLHGKTCHGGLAQHEALTDLRELLGHTHQLATWNDQELGRQFCC